MLPQHLNFKGVAFALLVLCVSSEFVNAGRLRPNKITELVKNSTEVIKEIVDAQLVDAPYKCYTCIDDCEDIEESICDSDENGSRCYMRFTEDNDIVGLGCISDFKDEQEIIDLIKQKSLYICDGELCNGFQNIPRPNDCMLCDSKANEDCATAPTIVIDSTYCGAIPYTQCYQRVDNDTGGITERGCLSTLDGDSIWECLSATTGGNCQLCTGNGCNNQVVPSNRLKCHRCDSSENSNCEENPASLSICPIYNKDDSCVATYVGGITWRDCQSTLNCNANDQSCQICKGEGCNIANVKKRANEIYGIFQDLPLNCYTCEGDECDSTENARKCEGNIYQDCLTVFDETGKVIRRGCELEVLEDFGEHCNENSELCFNCKSNGCNTVDDATKFQSCLYCNSANNRDCLFNPENIESERKCVEGCVASLYPRKSNPAVSDFVRTCFEDIEQDNRPDCTDENICRQCEGEANCNSDVFPLEGRLSCLHCDGEDCELPTSQFCNGLAADDQCYIFFDNVTYSAVGMGCVSDLAVNQVAADIKQYFICDGDNCNDYSNLPDARLCYTCDSSIDVNCAVDPSQITTQSRCQINPYTECYGLITSDGHTKRGCFYDLPIADFVKCKNGDPSINCRICTESGCNTGLYPSDRQQCHRCNSLTDSNCESAPASTQACPLYKEDDACVTKLINGETYRECTSELSCDDSNSKSCRTCSGQNCNVINLSEVYIGDPGLFQGLPLNCYHCDSEEDCSNSGGLVGKCEGNNYQTCTIAFTAAGNVAARGCSDGLDGICSSSDNTCYDCKSNGCNTANQGSDYIDCIFCDAQEGDSCIFEVDSIRRRRKCNKSCMTALYPRTNDINPVYELIHTCLDDMDLDDQKACEAGENKYCKSCNSDSCNIDIVGERKSCYHCTGDSCQAPELKTCRAVMEHDQCFIEYDETGVPVELGCKSKYDPKDVEILTLAKRLWLCDDDNCNDIENVPGAQRCTICSSRTDPNCAVNPSQLSVDTNCNRPPFTECYMRVLPGGHTERGCLASLENLQFYNCLSGVNSTECVTCSGDNCNKEIHPADRRSCHVCNSNSSSTCETSPDSAAICPLYNSNEQCVSLVNEAGITIRDCSSQLTCDSSNKVCETCNGQNCNDIDLSEQPDDDLGIFQGLPLNCYHCDSEEDCSNSGGLVGKCEGNIYQTCTVAFTAAGNVAARGCSDSLKGICSSSDNTCYDCKSNGCNIANQESDYIDCIYCNAKQGDNCTFEVDSITKRQKCHKSCMTALYPRTNDINPVYELIRTCLDHMDLDDQKACEAGENKYCKSCNSDSCNIDIVGERKSCYHCTGDSCQAPELQTCRAVSEHDQCFIEYDETGVPVELGCKSKYDPKDVEILTLAKRLWLCDDDNCNDIENVPGAQRCTICSSRTDPNCAVNPSQLSVDTNCNRQPFTECYMRVLPGGHTERGCLSSLENLQFYNCLNSVNSTECVICSGDNCNKQLHPEDRRSCHICSSDSSTACETSPNSAAVCLLYNTNQQCVSLINQNGTTVRGCSSQLTCDASDRANCQFCDSDNCNLSNLRRKSDGNPGMWQELPLTCHACDGVEDCKSSTMESTCSDHEYCMTVFDEAGDVQMRGCSDRVEDALGDYCDANSPNCYNCNSNKCNSATQLSDYINCYACDTATNLDCLMNPENVGVSRRCNGACMTALHLKPNTTRYSLVRNCLDDKDEVDRNTCQAGTDENCIACTGENCNTDNLPENPLSCYKCDSDDCETATPQTCRFYRKDDKCYTLFNNQSDVVGLGCGSDLDDDFIANNLAYLHFCNETNNCNSFDNLPKPKRCIVCNSFDDPDCASYPENIPILTTCTALPNTQCFTQVNNDGSTSRGCVSSLSQSALLACINGDSANCLACDQDGCNNQIYPANRRRCHRCNSKDDPTCEKSPSASEVCPFYTANEFCSSKLVNSYTYRGCSSDFTCDPSDRGYCRMCEGRDNCNTVDLTTSNTNIGYPGKWQDLPLSCHVCEGDECTSNEATLQRCEGNYLQNCQTIFALDGTVQKRSCSDDVDEYYQSYCDDNVDKCFSCLSNGCNNANSLEDYVDCYFCDSNEDDQCSVYFNTSTRTRKCQGSCMVALYPRSSAINSSYELSRSCSDDKEPNDREKCAAGEVELCVACSGDRCNTASVPEDRFECFMCQDEYCEDITPRQCSSYHPNDQCYILYDDEYSIAKMGCRSEYELDAVEELVKQKALLLCDGKNCNTPNIVQPKTCVVCDSSEDPRCATNPNLVDTSARCTTLPYTDCYTRINSDKHTERGCLGSLPTETFYGCLSNSDGLCETCNTSNCNSIDIYPANRLRCHQCDSDTNSLCTSSPDSLNVCQLYDSQDTCVTNLRNNVTYRGCSSSLKCDDETDRRTCRTCSGAGCNTIDLTKVSDDGEPGRWQDVPLTCHQCNSESDCEDGPIYNVCLQNPYQNCMTVFNGDGKVVARGCSDAVEAANRAWCESNPDNCPRCNSNGCNNAESLDDYVECLNCDTDTNGDCLYDVAGLTKTRKCHKYCMTALYPREREDQPAYSLERSCYDNMDLDDRNACEKGEKEYCAICSEAKCNTVNIPEKRLSCNICSGDSCQLPESKECLAYRENDKCFIEFDEQRSIVAMDCRSKYSNAEADYLYQQKRLFLCPDDNCNDVEALPPSQTCTICNSRTDIACATNPESLNTQVTCNVMPFPECYSRVLSNGATERGCVSSLYDDDFLNCLSDNNSTCRACRGNLCNLDVFPAGRASCHICDSTFDPTCESSPDNVNICPNYDPEETCITVYRDGRTQRGCSSSLSCDGAGSRGCSQCTGNGCNTIDLSKRQDDNFGKWQDLPLRCHVCSGEDCNELSEENVATCENNNEQDCVVVFDETGKVIERGCADDVEKTQSAYCAANADHCLNCKSNECNSADSLDEFVNCIYCDSHNNLDCLWQPQNETLKTRKCRGSCMTALYPTDSSSDPAYDLIRTCLNDKELADQTICSTGQDGNCRACSGDNCNTDDLPEDRRSCYYCASGDCEEPTTKKCPLYKKNDQCYIWFDDTNSVTDMGCTSSFGTQDLETIIKTKRFYICDEGDNCNSLNVINESQTCAVCDSRNDVLCAVDAKSVSTFQTCNILPYTGCYSQLNSDGSTSRGCLTDLNEDVFVECLFGNGTCEPCNGNACNREVYPADRLQCYTCSSLDDSACESFPTNLLACPVVNNVESCKSALSQNETIRGCTSQILCDNNDSRTCRTCIGTSCNSIDLRNKVDDGNHGYWQELPLKCHECIGDHCKNSLGPLVTCTRNLEQDCMTVFDTDGNVERRGCSDDVEDYYDLYCRQHPEFCSKCKSNECNFAWSLDEFVNCIYCDSKNNLDCLWQSQNETSNTRNCLGGCMTALYSTDQSNDPVYNIIRTCRDDKDTFDQVACSYNLDENCRACTDNNCNTDVIPENRTSCYHCTNGDCEEQISKKCPLYKENDQCYISFDETNSVEDMGCVTSLRVSDLETIIKTKRFYICDEGDNCNSLNLINGSQTCAVCDSRNDVLCAVDAKSVSTFKTCTMLPYTGCYSQLNSDGSTTRGCLADLNENVFVDCLFGDGNCEPCNGDSCNREVYPADRLQCYSCTSEDDDNCESFPTRMLPCPVVSAAASCKSALSQNETIRGCSSDILCDNNDFRTCRTCVDTSCNSIDLRNRVDDGYHGIWQELPLTCHECVGDHCKNSLGPLVTCTRNLEQDCMTVFDTDGNVERRGCSDDVEDYADLFCRQHPELCYKCKSNECNIAWSLDEYIGCTFCSSEENAACAIAPQDSSFASRKCYKDCMVTMRDNGTVIRSCTNDKEIFPQNQCRNEGPNGKECTTCETDNCNTFIYPANRLTCHICTGNNCNTSTGQYCLIYDENDFCFAKYENGEVDLLGCASSQNQSDLEEWENLNILYRCTSNDCNDLTKLPTNENECVSCDSSATPACAQNPINVNNVVTCSGSITDCVTHINSAGDTIRGCFNSLSETEQQSCNATSTCDVCEGERCNSQLFPSDRLRCHVCTGNNCNTSSGQYCVKYDENDFCFAKYENNRVDLMGCGSSQSKNDIEEWENLNKLYRCNGNDCNDLTKLPPVTLECVSCDSSNTAVCAQNPLNINTVVTCPISTGCVTYINSAGDTIRGCLERLSETEQQTCIAAGTCSPCPNEKCNSQVFPADRRRCHICSSVNDNSCEESPNALLICRKFDKDDSCVSKYENEIITRGCASDNLTCDVNDENNCQICNTDGCNTAELGSGAFIATGSLLLTTILAFITLFGLSGH